MHLSFFVGTGEATDNCFLADEHRFLPRKQSTEINERALAVYVMVCEWTCASSSLVVTNRLWIWPDIPISLIFTDCLVNNMVI
jgi:hypothetical protein